MKKTGWKLAAVIMVLLTGGCSWLRTEFDGFGPGTQDWNMELANGYELWRNNSQTIFVYRPAQSEYVIMPWITEFKMDERYFAAKQVEKPENPNGKAVQRTARFYLLDMDEEMLYGPYETEAELDDLIREKGIDDLGKWRKTSSRPKEANP